MNQHEEEEARSLVAELGLDDYLVETGTNARAALLERLQQGGRVVWLGAAYARLPMLQPKWSQTPTTATEGGPALLPPKA